MDPRIRIHTKMSLIRNTVLEILKLSTQILLLECNVTTAELDYMEVLELSMQILLLGQLASVRSPHCQLPLGEKDTRYNSGYMCFVYFFIWLYFLDFLRYG
jgi:hypothetical protein